MGTPMFAAHQLQALVDAGYEVVAVVTTPDKPAGRGWQMQTSAVKERALALGLPLLQPVHLHDENFLNNLRSYNADIFVVVAFRMLPQAVWQMPPRGTFNLHASLLPQYRGAAPIQWAIINGETQTGLTTFLIDPTMDTGNILLQQTVSLLPTDDAEILHDKLMLLAGDVIMRTINGLADQSLVAQVQPQVKEIKTAPKLTKSNTCINPHCSVAEAANFVRGLSPHPAAWMQVRLGNELPQVLKVYAAQAEAGSSELPAGTIVQDSTTLRLRCADGFLNILSLQLQGKKRMNTPDFLRGLRAEITHYQQSQ
ncbi:methionyl-tRNA formyltransferase [Bacteroidia bacterium]|nr:methionyl-tRNA formyltransferase [Bacteroidia bacterium]